MVAVGTSQRHALRLRGPAAGVKDVTNCGTRTCVLV
jgi:hypothetical protein